MSFIKDKLWIIMFLIMLGTVSSFSLELISNITAPVIARKKTLGLKEGILIVLDIPYQEKNIEEKYSEYISERTKNGLMYYSSKKDRSVALLIAGPGFWGEIKALIGLEDDLKTVTGFYVLEQEETPGLGGRISEKEFQDQFKGKSIKPKLIIAPAGKEKAGRNEVDAITGATMTSRAIEKIINKNLADSLPKIKGR